tara:strand:- start:957 stop:1274 length:318 start_codon:yes stop_codon:yes gene_type:complete
MLLIFLFPIKAFSAEILQIKGSNQILLGDQNRNYTVKLACIDIDSSSEMQAREWLKLNLPRKKPVNIRPISSDQGVLVARIIPFGSNMDVSEQMVKKGFGRSSCN